MCLFGCFFLLKRTQPSASLCAFLLLGSTSSAHRSVAITIKLSRQVPSGPLDPPYIFPGREFGQEETRTGLSVMFKATGRVRCCQFSRVAAARSCLSVRAATLATRRRSLRAVAFSPATASQVERENKLSP